MAPANDVILLVSGEVDILTAPMRSRLHHAASDGGRNVVVDLSAVTFMDCAGLRPLLEARRDLGPRLRLRRLPGALVRLLQLTGVLSAFTLLNASDADDQHGHDDAVLVHGAASHCTVIGGGGRRPLPTPVRSAVSRMTRRHPTPSSCRRLRAARASSSRPGAC